MEARVRAHGRRTRGEEHERVATPREETLYNTVRRKQHLTQIMVRCRPRGGGPKAPTRAAYFLVVSSARVAAAILRPPLFLHSAFPSCLRFDRWLVDFLIASAKSVRMKSFVSSWFVRIRRRTDVDVAEANPRPIGHCWISKNCHSRWPM